jgi:hypothetical protein
MRKLRLGYLVLAGLAGCSHAPSERPEATGPLMRAGLWRLTSQSGPLPALCVEGQGPTRLFFRVGSDGIVLSSFVWRREGKDAWRFESRTDNSAWEQVSDGRAVGDFRSSFAFSARVRGTGFDDPVLNGESTVWVQGRYAGQPTCPQRGSFTVTRSLTKATQP